MNLEQIRHRKASKAFVLSLSNGEKISIPHMDFMIVGRSVVVVMNEEDKVTTIDAEHIVAIEEVGNEEAK